MHVPVFTLFARDIPGSPDGIFAFATVLREKAKAGEAVFVAVRQSDGLAPSWRGTSADEYIKSKDAAADDFMNLTDGLYKAAETLDGYAWSLRARQSTAAEYKATLENYDRQLEQAPISQKGQVYNSLLSAAEEVKNSFTKLVEETEADMRVCAAELRNYLHIEALNYDKHGNNHGHQHKLSDADIARINGQLDRLDPSTVGQGKIGDCYYLAALGALMSTEKGRRHVRSCIRAHYDESGKQDGYLVTVYDNPLHPKTSRSQTVFVADVYEHGAVGDGSKPSVASLFEAAYGQVHPGGTRSSVGKQPGIDGGVAPKGFRHITGGSAHDVHPQKGPRGEFHYDDHKRRQIIEAAKTKAVVANTDKGMPGYNSKGEGHTVVEIDGKKQDMKMSPGHVYTLTRADASGVTLRNPWGHNDLASGGHAGAEFKMSWKQFETYCNSATIGEIP